MLPIGNQSNFFYNIIYNRKMHQNMFYLDWFLIGNVYKFTFEILIIF
jgi:hypothetical protein